jgi:antitoxin component YwqK of YwqJK toxin-antitoxin module
MKYKKIFALLIIVSSFQLYSQNDTIWYNKFYEKVSKSDASFFRERDSSSKKKTLFNYYDFHGNLQMIVVSRNNKPNFWDDGFISSISYQQIDGLEYRLEGKVLEDGIEEWKIYRDGILYIQSYYLNENRVGKWCVFHSNGVLSKVINYKICNYYVEEIVNPELYNIPERFVNVRAHLIDDSVRIVEGCLHGNYREYDKNGNLILSGRLQNNSPIDVWKYTEGNKIRIFDFSNISPKMLENVEFRVAKYKIDYDLLQVGNFPFEFVINIKKEEDSFDLVNISIDYIFIKYIIDNFKDIDVVTEILYSKIIDVKDVKIDYNTLKKEIKKSIRYYYYKTSDL